MGTIFRSDLCLARFCMAVSSSVKQRLDEHIIWIFASHCASLVFLMRVALAQPAPTAASVCYVKAAGDAPGAAYFRDIVVRRIKAE